MASLLHRHATYLGEGSIRARLYVADGYGAAVASGDPADALHGDLFELDPASAEEVMATLDAYEGDGYALREVQVALGETIVAAHAYLFAASVAGLPWIAHGRWPRQARRDGESG